MKNKRTSVRFRILRLSLIPVVVAILVLSAVLAIQLDYTSTTAYKSELESLSDAYVNNIEASSQTIRKIGRASCRERV